MIIAVRATINNNNNIGAATIIPSDSTESSILATTHTATTVSK